jgi:hypothetical protein
MDNRWEGEPRQKQKGEVVCVKGLGFHKFTDAKCELCELERTTTWYDDSSPHFGAKRISFVCSHILSNFNIHKTVVIECDQCDFPMAVLLSHTMEIDEKLHDEMELSLVRSSLWF